MILKTFRGEIDLRDPEFQERGFSGAKVYEDGHVAVVRGACNTYGSPTDPVFCVTLKAYGVAVSFNTRPDAKLATTQPQDVKWLHETLTVIALRTSPGCLMEILEGFYILGERAGKRAKAEEWRNWMKVGLEGGNPE